MSSTRTRRQPNPDSVIEPFKYLTTRVVPLAGLVGDVRIVTALVIGPARRPTLRTYADLFATAKQDFPELRRDGVTCGAIRRQSARHSTQAAISFTVSVGPARTETLAMAGWEEVDIDRDADFRLA